jgi:AraC-like DNA-binding protein
MNDRLAALLRRFALNAGPLRPVSLPTDISPDTVPSAGWLHLLLRGAVQLDGPGLDRQQWLQPALLWLPAPRPHRLVAMSERGATVLSAAVPVGEAALHPLVGALPAVIAIAQREMPRPMAAAWALAVSEFEAGACAHAEVLQRLADVLLRQVLRHQLDAARRGTGLLAALSDEALRRALDAMHDHPEHPWTLALLAAQAGLSRTALAERFRAVVGTTPMDYLTAWRLRLARRLLGQGHTLAETAAAVGYSTPATLSRVFVQRLGHPPGHWQPGRAEVPAGAAAS